MLSLNHYFHDFEFKEQPKKAKTLHYITKYSEYTHLLEHKYTIKDYRGILTRLQLPKCIQNTRRKYLQQFCTNMLYLSHNISKIQKAWRNHFIRTYNETLGPSYRHFEQSNNIDDFLTTDKIQDIPYYYYFSFRDKDNFVYTFHLVSIASLLSKNIMKNPYNRNDFDSVIVSNISKRMRMNKVLKQTHEFQQYQTNPTTVQDRVNQLFHHMDQIGGFYTSSSWFLQLRPHELRTFIYELHEIWSYRAELTPETKQMICPPRGNPFTVLPRNFLANHNNLRVYYSTGFLKNTALVIMEKLSYSAHNDANKNLGVLFILSAMTLVSMPAREALPWLYASVQYN